MSKKAPKNPDKKSKKAKEKQEKFIVIGAFFLFIAVIAFLFYYLKPLSQTENAVATINGKSITRGDLDWWYETSIIPEYRDFVKKQDFLALSLIPQEVLLQQAKKENVEVTEEEIEKFLGLYIIDSGLTLDEFEKHLNSKGISMNEIKKSFKTRAVITKLLDKENISLDEKGESAFDNNRGDFQEYLSSLIDNSKIEIFPENINKVLLKSFEATGDELCDIEKPLMRLYTTSWCETCNSTGMIFKNLTKRYAEEGSISTFHWVLDTGDNLLTSKKENGIPEKEVLLFKKYSPDNLVPTIVAGCKYKMIGSFSSGDEEEFKAILTELIGK